MKSLKPSSWCGLMLSIVAMLLSATDARTAVDTLTYYDNTNPAVTYNGTWNSNSGWPKAYNSTVSWSNTNNNQINLSFNGSSITRVYTMASNRGATEIYIDGALQSTSSDYSQTAIWQTRRTWSVPSGSHTIAVKLIGGGYIDADAFIVDVPIVGTGLYYNTDSQFNYIGTWSHSSPWNSAHNQTLSWSNDTESGVSFTFSGDVVTLYFTKTNNRGIAAITIDGVHKGYFDLFSSSTTWKDSIIFTGLSAGTHTINIAITGTKNASSSGLYVDVDALRVGTSSTPVLCPTEPKYGCTYVRHVPSLNITSQLVHSRFYSGGRDGGAQQWQLYWAKDQKYINSSWQTSETFSASSWYTNIAVGPYDTHGPERTRVYTSRVQMKYRHQECVTGQPCYYWCSPDATHYLSNSSSVNMGLATCYL